MRFARRIFPWGLALAIAMCLIGASLLRRPAEAAAAVAGASAAVWQYKSLPEAALPACDLRFRLQTGTAEGNGRFRLLIGDPDRNAFFVEIGPRGIQSGQILDGRERLGLLHSPTALAELAGAELVFELRSYRWALCADGRLLAGAADGPPVGAPIRFGTAAAPLIVSELRVQPAPDVWFTDSFMRLPTAPSLWTELNGEWRLNALTNPLLSANAFKYVAVGKTDIEDDAPVALAVAGEWFWSDLSFNLSCRPASAGAVGMILCYRGPEDYILFRWSARDAERPCRQIVRRSGGTETVLAEAPGGYDPDQWYALSASLGSGWMEASVDGTVLLRAADPHLTYGKIGLYAEGAGETTFDDVAIGGLRATRVDFGPVCSGYGLMTGGDWMPVAASTSDADAWPGGVVVRSAKSARLIWGDRSWRDYALSARVGPLTGGAAGLCFRYQDEKNYCLALLRNGPKPTVELVRVLEGRPETLALKEFATSDVPRRLEIRSEADAVTVNVDGRAVLRALEDAIPEGRIGLYADAIEHGAFSDVVYRFLEGERPVNATRQVFAAEESMLIWSGAMSDWVDPNEPEEPPGSQYGRNRPVVIQPKPAPEPGNVEGWHRSDFFGDVRIEMRLAEPLETEVEAGLVVGASTRDAATGFAAAVRCVAGDGESPPTTEAVLRRPDGTAQSAAISWEKGPLTLSLGRIGEMIVLCVDGRALLTARDERESPGRRLGWFSRGVEVDAEDLVFYTKTLVDYTFNSAPTDWRVASGIWEVTNRWTCDPRWSFFSGRQKDVTAALWNKRPIRGDFTIEFYAGIKMDPDRQDSGRYTYAKDMNLTVCADGDNLDTGYSFLFGGFGNTITCAYRGEERWALPSGGNSVLIDPAGLHRRWYHIAVSRRGNRFEMRVDDRLVLSREDPTPLEGGHWALWTRDNGIMVARVRVCAEEIGSPDSPDIVRSKPSRSIYGD